MPQSSGVHLLTALLLVSLACGCGGGDVEVADSGATTDDPDGGAPTSDGSAEVEPPPAESPGGLVQHPASDADGLGHWLYAPANATEGMPLVVYLHGGSGRGSDLNLVVGGSLPRSLSRGTVGDVRAYVLIPQCPSGTTWEQIGASVIGLIDSVVADRKIDVDRVSLTGHSLGGTGTWNLAAAHPEVFSAIAPLSGSVSTSQASSYAGVPVWALVGSADTIVDPGTSEAIVPLINDLGGDARITVFEGATHVDVPDLAYEDSSIGLLDWLLDRSRN